MYFTPIAFFLRAEAPTTVNEAAAVPPGRAGRAWHCFRRLRRRKRRHARPAGAAAASLTVVSASALKWLLSRRPRSKQRDGTLSTTNLGQKLKKNYDFFYFWTTIEYDRKQIC